MNLDDIAPLLKQWGQKDNYKLPSGATDRQIDTLEQNIRISLPDELRQWLKFSNAPVIYDAGILGIATRQNAWGIERDYRARPEWEGKGWIPIASDGCGDRYVLDVSIDLEGSHPIYFFDQANWESPDYLIASGL